MFLRLFRWYSGRFLARHFHAVRVAGRLAVRDDLPMVLYTNHASWWDPLLMLLLSDRLLPHRRHYAPVDKAAIERYRMFKRLGFFGVEQQRPRGARAFLDITRSILDSPQSVLWMTPQGRFADVRERPPGFQRGLSLLATRCPQAVFVPVAVEYTFWQERLPEALVWIGRPTLVDDRFQRDKKMLNLLFESNLSAAQDQLASASMHRETDRFVTLLKGRTGVNGIYDAGRFLAAKLRGQAFTKAHGEL